MFRKGALTVEASMVLPVFMLVILSLAMAMRVYLAYEKIEFAVFKTGMQISEKAYILKMANLIPEESEYGQKVEDLVKKAKEKVGEVDKSFGGVKTSVDVLRTTNFLSSDILNLKSRLEDVITSLENLFNTVIGAFNELKPKFSEIANVEEFKGWLKDFIFSGGSGLLLNSYVEHSIKNELGNDINTYITGKFDMKESKYFTSKLELDGKSVESNERALMLIDVKYKIKIPMAFMYGKFTGKFDGHTRQVFRAWVGE